MENSLETKNLEPPAETKSKSALGNSKALYKLLYSCRTHVHLCVGFLCPNHAGVQQ